MNNENTHSQIHHTPLPAEEGQGVGSATLVFATNNAHKLEEVRQILGHSIEVLGLKDIGCEDDIPETADTFEGNAWQKARYVKEHYGYDCMADDSGLEVDALGGAPGVHSARYASEQGHDSEANMSLLLRNLQGVTDRNARFRTALALIFKGEEKLFNGTVEGSILTERHGTGGFGYDPVFRPDGYEKTFAEMTADEKNAISHRGRAIQQLVQYLRQIKILLLFLLCPLLTSAQALGTWSIYPSYTCCTKNIPVGNRIYALMESKLMAYDTEDTSIQTWDVLRGLSDVTIKDIAYSAEAKRIVLVYDNGNIDLLSTEDDDDIINLAYLKNSSLQGRDVNGVGVDGKMVYICTGFGIVAIDAEAAVIRNTYQLGLNVTACAANDDAIFAGTSNGIWRGLKSSNLQDKTNWKQVDSNIVPTKMVYFDGSVWVAVKGNLYKSNSTGDTYTSNIAFTALYMNVDGDRMVVGNKNFTFVFSSATNRKSFNLPGSRTDLHMIGNTFWSSDGIDGLQAYTLQEDNTLALTIADLHVNSPLHDYSFHLRLDGDRLFVSGGSYNYSYTSFTGTAMILEPDGSWINFDEVSAAEIAPKDRFLDVTDIAQDPNDDSHHFVGTARSGMYEFRDAKCVGHYSFDNSPLVSILPDSPYPQYYVVADGTRYDAEGNLWVLNPSDGKNDTIIRILKPNGKWHGLQYDEIASVSAMDNILFDSRGWVWINSRRMSGRGIFCLDYNGTIDVRSDDRHILRSSFVNQDGTSYAPNEYYCTAEDIDGTVWIGTDLGPFRVSDPESFFSSSFSYEQVKVARNDGSGLADYLLSNIPIKTIAIDGAGRKWFGTTSNGVYLISADCQEQIYHFTTDNSSLPSNDVFDIAINGNNGIVYFATSKGLCSFVSDATTPVEDLDDDQLFVFPNPVTPDYSGPITVRGLTANSEVKVVSTTGQIIYRGYSNGGTFTWNGCNQRGARVSSGIYFIIASTANGDKAASTKITLIR